MKSVKGYFTFCTTFSDIGKKRERMSYKDGKGRKLEKDLINFTHHVCDVKRREELELSNRNSGGRKCT